MSTTDIDGLKSSRKNQVKIKKNLQQLKDYIKQSPYIEKAEQPKICMSFGLPYMPSVFREEYTERFKLFLKDNVATSAQVDQATGIPQKYLTQVKYSQERKGALKVVGFGRCPSTGSAGVQFLSTNPNNWNDIKQIPKDKLK